MLETRGSRGISSGMLETRGSNGRSLGVLDVGNWRKQGQVFVYVGDLELPASTTRWQVLLVTCNYVTELAEFIKITKF